MLENDRQRDPAQPWRLALVVLAVAVVHVSTWILADGAARRPAVAVQVGAAWIATLLLGLLAARRIGWLSARLTAKENAHRAVLDEVAQLQTQNAMLDIVARSVDVPLTFQALAFRIARLVPCERVGLALLTESGQEFETYTARVQERERRSRPRPDVVFKTDGTAIGTVVRTVAPMLITDMGTHAQEYIDVNVSHTAGFRSGILLPLISRGRAVGTLNVVSRSEGAFTAAHLDVLRPIAEILAVAHVVQRQQMLLSKYKTIEGMSEVMLAISAEMNSALQTIVGHCALLARTYTNPELQSDLAMVERQAARLTQLLEKMRSAAHERLKEAVSSIEESRIPTSPDAYEQPFT